MTLFVATAEQKLLKELNIVSKETSNLLGKLYQNNFNIKNFVEIFNEISDINISHNVPLIRHVFIKARIFKLNRLQKELRKIIFHQVLPTENREPHQFSNQTNRTGYGQMHRFSTNYDIHLAEASLREWTTRASQLNVDITEFHDKIKEARVLKDSYNPSNKSEFGDRFINLFFVHYLNLFTNKIINKVAKEIVIQHAKALRENPNFKDKISLINQTERWLLGHLPLGNTFLSPANEEQKTLNVLRQGEEQEHHILAN